MKISNVKSAVRTGAAAIAAGACLAAVGVVVQAGIQRSQSVGSLTVAPSFYLAVHDGRVGIVWKAPPAEEQAGRHWSLSAPLVANGLGRVLAFDPESRAIRLSDDRKQQSEWRFEFVSQLEPKTQRESGTLMKEGDSGRTFRLIVAEGPRKGWYVGIEAPAADEGAKATDGFRPLELVRDKETAVEFRYVDTHYHVHHK